MKPGPLHSDNLMWVRINPTTYKLSEDNNAEYIYSLRGTVVENKNTNSVFYKDERWIQWDSISGLAVWPTGDLTNE